MKSLFQISFFSTSPELSNKQRFEYFSRTIPSDHYQTMAMAKIVERLGWKYMSIVYEESNYGIKVNFPKALEIEQDRKITFIKLWIRFLTLYNLPAKCSEMFC